MSVITTRRTDFDRRHTSVKSEEQEISIITMCPLTRMSCLGESCVRWDEDYHVCSMSPLSLYNQIRDAVTDAAVDIIKNYKNGSENHG